MHKRSRIIIATLLGIFIQPIQVNAQVISKTSSIETRQEIANDIPIKIQSNTPKKIPEETITLEQLINLPEKDLAKIDIAAMNLAAAEGLPGSENLDRKKVLQTLDTWARRIAAETENNAHVFGRNLDYYENSWAKYCSVMLVLTLQQELGVHYNIEQRTKPSLAKSQDQFINGIVDGTGGTCASLPVLIVAVGRRLGYPLRLAQSYSHYYARWDDPVTGEKFNIEASGPGGLDFLSDDFYRNQARERHTKPPEGGNYLKSMSPREELSTFITTRADCLKDNGRWVDAYHTYKKAVELAPQNLFAADLLEATGKTIQHMRDVQQINAAIRRSEKRRRDPRWMIPGLPNAPSVHAFRQTAGQDRSRTVRRSNLNAAGWKPPTMQDYLNDTNRRNQQLMRYGQPGIARSHRTRLRQGALPTSPQSQNSINLKTPQSPNYGRRP